MFLGFVYDPHQILRQLFWCFSPILPASLRRLIEDQEVTGSTPAEVGNILSSRLIMKYFLSIHSLPFADSRRAVVSFLQKNMHNTG